MKKAVFDPGSCRTGSSYPPPYNEPCMERRTWPLTRDYGLTQFGVNRVELPPGCWSTQRHWHKTNDEVVVVVEGEVTLVSDDGEEVLGPGDCVAFRMGDPNPHNLQNRSDKPAVFFDIGGRDLWDVSTFPECGFVAKPKIEIGFRPIRPKP